MTAAPEAGKSARRHPGVTRHIAAVLPTITRTAFRSAGPATALLIADWRMIVGSALAAISVPRRLSAGTLTLGCNGPVALELQHLSSQLIERINVHLGRPQVQRIRLVQEASRIAPTSPPAPPVTRDVRPPRVIDGIPEGPLRDALARLGGTLDGEPA